MPFIPKLRDLVEPTLGLVIVASLVILIGIAFGAIHKSFHGSWPERLRKGIAVGMVLGGAVTLWLVRQAPKQKLPYEHDETAAFAKARNEHKLLMIDFSADWCNPCHALERGFGTDDVYAAITKDFVPLKMDMTKDSDENQAIKDKYKAPTLPAVLFLDPSTGEVFQRIDRELEPDQILEVVKKAATHHVGLDRTGC
jgi:thiol:disulfide interchange protein